MPRNYVEKRDGGYYLSGSRVSLDSIIHEFLEGASPETIQENFPTLTLEEVYGAITFYLAHRAELGASLSEAIKHGEEIRRAQPSISDDLRERLMRARAGLPSERT